MTEHTRPLSPHLQVYKPQLTSMLSILHRGTGIALAVGTLMLSCWILSLASGPAAYDEFAGFAGSWFGQFLLLGWTFSLFYHLANGIRHLLWDAGWGLDIDAAYTSGYMVIAASVVLTAATWFIALT